MKHYKRLSLMVEDLKSGKIPAQVVSPGAAAAVLGLTRQAVWNRCNITNSLEAWGAEGVVFISEASIRKARKKKLNIPDSQRELLCE